VNPCLQLLKQNDPSTNVQGHTELAERMKKNILLIFILIIFSLPSIIPLFHRGFFPTDDGNWMVIRFSAFYEALRHGQFPVRFLPRLNNGYGYPVADFLYPLFMYIGVPIHVLGFSFVDTIKLILGASLISSSFFCFLWLKKIFGNVQSSVGALIYTLFPYHLWDVYKRGSVGEVLALSIVPFILWSLENNNVALAGLGYGLLITAHNTLALIFIPVIFIYDFISSKKDKRSNLLNSLKPLVLGIGASSFFWVPALYDKQFTVFDKTKVSDFSNYFITLKDFNLLGLISLAVILASLLLLYKNRKGKFIYFIVITIIAIFLSTPFSKAIWDIGLLPGFVQFPFRFLSVVALGVSYLAAYSLSQTDNKYLPFAAFFYLILIFFSAKDFIYPKTFQNYPDTFYSTNQDTTTVKNEYMPKWVKKIPVSIYKEKVEVLRGDGKVQNLFNNGNRISFNISSSMDTQLQINTVYFPEWKVRADGKEIPISYSNPSGLIRFNIPQGVHAVRVSFFETPIRILADLISIGGIISLFIIGFKKKLFYEFN